MGVFRNLTGLTFGKLHVIKRIENNHRNKTCYLIQCSCGSPPFEVRADSLTTGNTKSCGCIQAIYNCRGCGCETSNRYKGNSVCESCSKIYSRWVGMRSRCYCLSDIGYRWYGGRGITICPEWLNSVETFYQWAITHGYQPHLSIDRINNDGNYEPSNCRWATDSEQMLNRRPYVYRNQNADTFWMYP